MRAVHIGNILKNACILCNCLYMLYLKACSNQMATACSYTYKGYNKYFGAFSVTKVKHLSEKANLLMHRQLRKQDTNVNFLLGPACRKNLLLAIV